MSGQDHGNELLDFLSTSLLGPQQGVGSTQPQAAQQSFYPAQGYGAGRAPVDTHAANQKAFDNSTYSAPGGWGEYAPAQPTGYQDVTQPMGAGGTQTFGGHGVSGYQATAAAGSGQDQLSYGATTQPAASSGWTDDTSHFGGYGVNAGASGQGVPPATVQGNAYGSILDEFGVGTGAGAAAGRQAFNSAVNIDGSNPSYRGPVAPLAADYSVHPSTQLGQTTGQQQGHGQAQAPLAYSTQAQATGYADAQYDTRTADAGTALPTTALPGGSNLVDYFSQLSQGVDNQASHQSVDQAYQTSVNASTAPLPPDHGAVALPTDRERVTSATRSSAPTATESGTATLFADSLFAGMERTSYDDSYAGLTPPSTGVADAPVHAHQEAAPVQTNQTTLGMMNSPDLAKAPTSSEGADPYAEYLQSGLSGLALDSSGQPRASEQPASPERREPLSMNAVATAPSTHVRPAAPAQQAQAPTQAPPQDRPSQPAAQRTTKPLPAESTENDAAIAAQLAAAQAPAAAAPTGPPVRRSWADIANTPAQPRPQPVRKKPAATRNTVQKRDSGKEKGKYGRDDVDVIHSKRQSAPPAGRGADGTLLHETDLGNCITGPRHQHRAGGGARRVAKKPQSSMPRQIPGSGYEVNPLQFKSDPQTARFHIIKSYSEDDVHKSIKYGVWASTDSGNRRLDASHRQQSGRGPVLLFFSVNASGQFCGLAEMTSSLDYQTKCDCWAQDKWRGHFSVRWLFIKDIPNKEFRHIRIRSNDNKPVTNSRDTQEVPPEQGAQILDIFESYHSESSLLDDFQFYDGRQMAQEGVKDKQKSDAPEGAGGSAPQAMKTITAQAAAAQHQRRQQQQAEGGKADSE